MGDNDSGSVRTWICSRCKAVYNEPRERCSADGRRVIENLRGTVFGGRWIVQMLLGVGGDGGSVWQAGAREGGRDVAIKVLPVSDQTAAQRFERGARISGMLDHRHITRVIEHGRTDEWFYLVMELLEGETLQRHLMREKRLPVAEVVALGDQMLRALEYTHALNVVHRDLKPGNVFISTGPDGKLFVKVLDYGISKHFLQEETARPQSALLSVDALLSESDADEFDERLHITGERQILGTPEYMAPEQITGGALDARADIYGLGVLLYRMLAGHLPFEAKTRTEIYRRHLFEAPAPFEQALEVPKAVERVVLRALAKLPGDRWQTATAMRQALSAARASLPLTATGRAARPEVVPEIDPMPTGASKGMPPTRRKRGVVVGLAALAGVAGVAVALVFVLGKTAAPATADNAQPQPQVARETTPSSAPAAIKPVAEVAPEPKAPGATTPTAKTPDPSVAGAPVVVAELPAVPVEAPEITVNIAAGGAAAEVFFCSTTTGDLCTASARGRSLGMAPLSAKIPKSELPGELTIKRAGFRTATRVIALADDGQDVDVPLVRFVGNAAPPVKRPDPGPRPGNTINLQR